MDVSICCPMTLPIWGVKPIPWWASFSYLEEACSQVSPASCSSFSLRRPPTLFVHFFVRLLAVYWFLDTLYIWRITVNIYSGTERLHNKVAHGVISSFSWKCVHVCQSLGFRGSTRSLPVPPQNLQGTYKLKWGQLKAKWQNAQNLWDKVSTERPACLTGHLPFVNAL